jgi:glutathione S-transferase
MAFMKLYIFPLGPFPRRLLCFMKMKGITGVELIERDIFDRAYMASPEFLALTPAASLPVLVTDDGISITQSQAMMNYLEELYPERPLCGRNERERRLIETQAQLINDIMAYRKISVSTTSPSLMPYQKIRAPEASLMTEQFDWSRCEQISIVMDRVPFLAGDQPTMADIMLYTMLEYLRPVYDRFFPPHLHNLTEWYDRFGAIYPLERYRLTPGYLNKMSGRAIKERP